MSVYDPNRSSAGTDTIVDWCRTEGVSASDDITTVPGVGPAFKDVLEDSEIYTVAQMIGLFLMEIDGERSAQEVCQAGSQKRNEGGRKAGKAGLKKQKREEVEMLIIK